MKEVEQKKCLHCGQTIYYSKPDNLWHHEWGRWNDDNGYWCYEGNLTLSANPRTKEENDYRRDRYVIKFDKEEGKYMVRTPSGEWEVDKYMNEE